MIARKVPFIPGMESADCGAAALAMTLAHHGRRVGLSELHELVGTGREGVTAASIVEAARHYGLRARGVQVDLDELDVLPRGSILHWELQHFVVFDRVRRKRVELVDPAAGRCRVPMTRFSKLFTGVAIIFDEDDGLQATDQRPARVWRHVRHLLDQRSALRRVIVTSLLLRLFALALPVFTGLIVDQVLGRGDLNLLGALAAAMAVVFVYHTAVAYLRGQLLLRLRTQLDLSMTIGFFEHLVDLPYAFFLKRTAGDLMMRLRSNTIVRELLTTGAISALLDGGLATLYLVLLAALSPKLGALVALLGVAQVAVLLLARRPNQYLMAESLQAEAKSQAYAYQLLSGMETLKAAGAERRSVEHWTNLFVDEINVAVRRGRLGALVDAATTGLRLGSPLAVLVLGATLVVHGHLSIGTMLALAALAAGFLEPLATLVTTGLQLQLLGSYLDRINDVLDTPTESGNKPRRGPNRLTGDIRAEDVSFRYANLAPLVIDGISLEIQPGQKVGIVGRSGSGKSTLGRLLLGLYPPVNGRVLHDGTDLAELDPRAVRAQLGVVTQDAQLFGVSIRQNIALAEPSLPLEVVQETARLACVHDDVEAMDMGYDTLLVDGGASLSGGQRQRIVLARALVHRPRVLFLDEATSALDTLTEAAVYTNLASLSATQIVIAHRLTTVADADLILVLDQGRLVESGTHAQLLRRKGLYAEMVGTPVRRRRRREAEAPRVG
jgi:ABC-type bacteriocin/lantibiotic exporter with double-glycine peptidase domain